MKHPAFKLATLTAIALGLAACGGGGGGGSSLASTPPPPPPPPPPPVIPPAHIGLVNSAPFAVQAMSGNGPVDVQFSYNASTNTYQISLPGFQPGSLIDTSYNGTSGQVATGSFSWVSAGSTTTRQAVNVTLPVPGSSFSPYTYSGIGFWDGQPTSYGMFAYGIPTSNSDVPITGSATYSAGITGGTSLVPYYTVEGPVSLQFNFGAGTLSGFMDPEVNASFDGVFADFGRFDFTQTVYSTGSATFSGKFIAPGLPNANSSFNGSFNGPGAAELMARFQTQALYNGQQGTIWGIWVGKKN